MSTNDWSMPDTAVFERIRETLDDGADAVLATVTDVDGSAYRRPGAKMLLRADGGGGGSITAGCLEDEVRALVDDVLAAGAPRVETWDLTGDDDVWGLGVGCNGVITVLLEPLTEAYRPVVEAHAAGDDVAVLTVVGDGGDGDAPPVGAREFYRPGDGFVGDALPEEVRERLAPTVEDALESGHGDTVAVDVGDDGTVTVFVDGVRAPPELVVLGSGNDVAPVVELASRADFRVTVVSFRGGQADASRFPAAESVVSASPRDVADLREWDEDTYVVVMTHNFLDDRLAVDALLDTPVPYIGLMGPRDRFEEMREDFEADGRTLTDAEADRLYTPVGLSLGGDAPYQIAVSIVGELLAVVHDREPAHLSRQAGPIHARRTDR